eukprot:Tbor_TRINITY_DN5577_c1_g2::TRINITY_DN5577_c1_g2_i1::g.12700::m.12700
MHLLLRQLLLILFLGTLYVYLNTIIDTFISSNLLDSNGKESPDGDNGQKGTPLYSSGSSTNEDLWEFRDKKFPNALNHAVETQDLQGVRDHIAQSEKVSWVDIDRSPLTILADSDEWTTERQAILDHLLAQGISVNNGYKKRTPLETAAAKRNYYVFRALFEYPETVKLIRPQGLDCGVISWITTKFGPHSVKYVVPQENDGVLDCFIGLPDFMKVSSDNDLLGETFVVLKKTHVKEKEDSILVSPVVEPLDPFTPLPPNIYPPRGRGHYVLNPSPFGNIFTATLYYLTGLSFSVTFTKWSIETIGAVIYFGVCLIMCSIAVGLLISLMRATKAGEREGRQ